MEVKAIEGLGKAVDAILVNGRLKTNDIIVLGGQNGPICTHVKQIFTPPANKDQFNTVRVFIFCTVSYFAFDVPPLVSGQGLCDIDRVGIS